MRFAVIGGDGRFARLCRLLGADGHEVRAFALEKAELGPGTERAADISGCVHGAECAVLPLPLSGKPGILSAMLSPSEHRLEDIFAALPPGIPVCAGRVSSAEAALARRHGIELCDYFRREELCVMNAAATAEGAVELLIRETREMLLGAEVLVIGFGRIGRILARRLAALGARVAVSSRKYADQSWCRVLGYEPLDTRRLAGHLGRFRIVVNTVPAPVLTRPLLGELQPGAVCMDLASRPGGVDFEAAAELGVHTIWALSLPGETAPDSAGEMIRDTIYNILREQELM